MGFFGETKLSLSFINDPSVSFVPYDNGEAPIPPSRVAPGNADAGSQTTNLSMFGLDARTAAMPCCSPGLSRASFFKVLPLRREGREEFGKNSRSILSSMNVPPKLTHWMM
jgi:hypothetical protein